MSDEAKQFDQNMIDEFKATDGAAAKASKRLLWERKDDESAKAFEAFDVYLKLGAKRSLAKVGQALGKSTPLMERWSSQHSWVRRAESFDAEQNRLYHLDLAERRKDMAERHVKEAQSLQAVAMRALKEKFGDSLDKIAECVKDIKATDILRIFTEAAKMERIALGEPSEIVEQQHTGGLIDERDRKPLIPLTFAGRIEQAIGLLETARERAAIQGAEQPDR